MDHIQMARAMFSDEYGCTYHICNDWRRVADDDVGSGIDVSKDKGFTVCRHG